MGVQMKSVLIFLSLTLSFLTFSNSFDILIDSKPLKIINNGCSELAFRDDLDHMCYQGAAEFLVSFMNSQNCRWGDGVFMDAQILAEEKISYVHYHLGGVEPAVILEKCQD